ncbi:piwi-like protein 1 [Leucoraja erinacea]|uniref:piwi-like protein 1 n=1 Tax=Leucoraja erinaceus TaxID=7782 RepID=UPI002456CFF9|nr:piwi-like protein 1 [Leucoraja erinacea]
MTGRARSRARGRTRVPEVSSQPLAPRLEPSPIPPRAASAGEPELLGRGRQRGPSGALLRKDVEVVSAGFKEMSLTERGGRRRDFHDLGVNTRKTMEHVKESKTGSSGSAIRLITNYVRLNSCAQWLLYQYHVDYEPQMESRRLRTVLLFMHENVLGRIRVFDGGVLFLPKRLETRVTELRSQTRDGQNVNVTVTLTNELPPTSPTCLQFYNIVFRRLLKIMCLQQIGRNYYNPKDPIMIPQHRIMVWPGYTTSILQYESNVMLCADVSHKILRSDTVHDVMHELYAQFGEQRFQEACSKELVGVIVLTRYNNKTYRIDDIDWFQNPQSTFNKGGTQVSYIDYYKKQYSMDIDDVNQPVLVSQPRRQGPAGTSLGPICLIPELCYLTGMTDKMRSDFNVMRDLSAHTRLTPEQREQQLWRFVDYIQSDENVQKELSDWGIQFDSKLHSLSGRVVPTEKIQQGGKMFDYNPQAAEWSRETRGSYLINPVPLENWVLVFTRRNTDVARSLFQTLGKVVKAMGIRMEKPLMVEVEDRSEAFLRALQSNVTQSTRIVVCVLPSNRKDKYDTIKKYLCVECPTPSQCVVARTLSKPQALMAIATKIALQINCKMGGELWSVEIPLKQLMVIGIDCYHDNAAGRKSIAGFVASLNQTITRWFSRCIFQDRGQELVDGLKVCLQAALKAWHACNKCLPGRIIVYRDGVGDGQLNTVVNYEIPQLLDCLKYLPDYNPKLSVIVVKKRVNARFFSQAGGRLQNPPPGTVIDTDVTRPEWYDFYIVSQSVKVGTVTPTHYNVVFDNSNLKPDYMQRLTYKLCHMYYNWPGVIRVPAPCQYAHKLAFLVGQSIHREPSLALADRLYYL